MNDGVSRGTPAGMLSTHPFHWQAEGELLQANCSVKLYLFTLDLTKGALKTTVLWDGILWIEGVSD